MITLVEHGPNAHMIEGDPKERLRVFVELDLLFVDQQTDLVKPVPSELVRSIPYAHLYLWMHMRNVYVLPTFELIEALRAELRAPAIEVGAGHGALGRTLGIPITDCRIHETKHMCLLAVAQGQMPRFYPKDVERLEALEAVRKYRAQTVLMAWVTHWEALPFTPAASTGGSDFGVRDVLLMEACPRIILVGTRWQHGKRPLLSGPVREAYVNPPWLFSRSPRGDNVIWVRDR